MSNVSHPRLAIASHQLLSVLVESPTVEAFLDQVVRLAEAATPADACGITVGRGGQAVTVASSNDFAAQVDEIQYGADEGPCLDTLRGAGVVPVDDLAGERRWDNYRPHALAHGVGSSLSLPLRVDGQIVAALNLYSRTPQAFDSRIRQHAEALAAQCAAALTLALRQADQAQLQEQLGQAMASRAVIDQAIGILMAQQRCTAATAFDLLRRASQNRNRKLHDVAADIITNVTGQPPQPPRPFRP